MPWNPSPKLLVHALFQLVADDNSEAGRAKREDATPETADFLRKLHRDFCAAFRVSGDNPALADRHFHAFAEQACDLKVKSVDQVVVVVISGQKVVEFHAGGWYHYSLATKMVGFGKAYKQLEHA